MKIFLQRSDNFIWPVCFQNFNLKVHKQFQKIMFILSIFRPGLCKLTRKWSSENGFEFSFPSVILDLISASLFFDGGKVRPQLGSTSSIEKSFLSFLHKLSFSDFAHVPTFLTMPEEFDVASFMKKYESDRRSSFPAMCIVTPFDVTPSSYTRHLDAVTLTRQVG